MKIENSHATLHQFMAFAQRIEQRLDRIEKKLDTILGRNDLIGTKRACEITGLTPAGLRLERRAGTIPFIQPPGTHPRYTASDCENWRQVNRKGTV